jgi:hypothetical protein
MRGRGVYSSDIDERTQMATPKHPLIDARGKWVIIDLTEDGASLLAVGDEDYSGISPKNWLDERARFILLAKLRNSLTWGEDFEGISPYSGSHYKIVTKAIWSPDHKQVVGAMGIYDHRTATLPPLPLVGAWQWRVDRAGKNVGEDSSRWDSNLFVIYGITAEMITSHRGPAGEWQNKLIASRDRDEMKRTIDNGVTVNNHNRHLLSYEITYEYGSSNPSKKQISMSARAYADPDYPEAIMLRGFSREVASRTKPVTPGLAPVPPGQIPNAIFALSGERAFAAIDLPQDTTFQTSSSWAALGLQPNFENNVAALAHPDDKSPLEQHLNGVAEDSITPTTVITARLRTTDEAWRTFDITASRIDTDTPPPSRYLMISLIRKGP